MKRPPLWYPEVPLTAFLRRNTKSLRDKYAIVYPLKLTFSEFWSCVDGLASALGRVGVGKGERVCLFEWNSPEFEIAFNAVVEAGAVVVPLNPMYKEMELEFFVNDSEAETIIVRDKLYPKVKKSCLTFQA